MIIYIFFLILSFLPLIEGELLGVGRFIFLAFCLPLSIYLFKRKGRAFTFKAGPLIVIFSLFLFFATLATIFSPVFSRSLNTLVLYFAYFIYFLSSQVLVKEKKELFKELLVISILFPSLILCFLSFYFLIAKEPPPFAGMNLIFANFGHNHLVDFLIFAFPLALVLFFKEKKKNKKLLFLCLNLIFLTGFILSFSRGGILMAILEILLFILMLKKTKKLTNREAAAYQLFSFFITLLLVLSLGVSIFGYYYFGKEKVKGLENFFLKKAFREPPISSRLDYYRQTILAFKERSIMGWGLDNFRYLSSKYQSEPNGWSWHSHNHFLQMFAETGIFGGIILLLLILSVIKRVRPWLGLDPNLIDIGLKIGLGVSIIHSLFDYDWQFSSVFLLFWTISGFLICHSRGSPVEGDKSGSGMIKIYRAMFLFLGGIIFMIAIFEFTSNILLFKGNYEKSLKIWPFKLENWQAAANYYQKNNQLDKSLAILNKLIILEPISDRNYFSLAEIYKQKNQPDKAFTYYLEALKLNPKQENIYYELIDLWPLKKNKNWPEFFNLLERLETAKGPYCLLKCLGFSNEEKILNQLLQLISRRAGSPSGRKSDDFNQLNQLQQARVYYWLAMLTTYQKDWDQDIDFLQKAVTLDNKKDYRDFLNDLLLVKKIQASYESKNYTAVKNLSINLQKKEKNHIFHEKFYLDEIYYLLAEIAFTENNLIQAESYWIVAKTINPWGEKSYLKLAQLYKKIGNQDKEKTILTECSQADQWKDKCKAELITINDNQ